MCSLWLAFITPFLCRHDFELAVFVRSAPVHQLIVGFNGASARTFRALMDPQAAEEDLIPVSNADWVEDMVDQTYGLRKLCHGLHYNGRSLPPCKVSWQNEVRLRFALKGVQGGQLRDMCAQVGLEVVSIRRLRIGKVSLAKMPVGLWRYLPVGERF